MSLYRETGGRRLWPLAAAVAALLLAVGAGFAAGRATSDTSLADALEPVRTDTQEILAALELVELHYPEEDDPSDAELTASRDQAQRLRDGFDDADDDLALLAPDATEEARTAVEEVVSRVDEGAPAGEVRDAVAGAERAVRALPTAG